ncbi:hypothetical protein F5Y05DRAFT_368777 [Hypoxylon sp. FL0543]|nr:hypothetical protein F5Y05DRAFT_368777 [Hypoxylon sp. FL0543]
METLFTRKLTLICFFFFRVPSHVGPGCDGVCTRNFYFLFLSFPPRNRVCKLAKDRSSSLKSSIKPCEASR